MKPLPHQKPTSHSALYISADRSTLKHHNYAKNITQRHNIEGSDAEHRHFSSFRLPSIALDRIWQPGNGDKKTAPQRLELQQQRSLIADRDVSRAVHGLCRYGLFLGLLFPIAWIVAEASFWGLAPVPAHVGSTPETFVPTPNRPPVFTRGSGTR